MSYNEKVEWLRTILMTLDYVEIMTGCFSVDVFEDTDPRLLRDLEREFKQLGMVKTVTNCVTYHNADYSLVVEY